MAPVVALGPELEEDDDDPDEDLSQAFVRLAIVGGLGGLLL